MTNENVKYNSFGINHGSEKRALSLAISETNIISKLNETFMKQSVLF